jgi:hypothetical protein
MNYLIIITNKNEPKCSGRNIYMLYNKSMNLIGVIGVVFVLVVRVLFLLALGRFRFLICGFLVENERHIF